MKKANQILPGCAMAVSYTDFVCWLFCMSQLEAEYVEISVTPLLLACYYIGIYLLNCFLSTKNAPLALYVALQLIFGAGAVVLFLLTATIEPFSLSVMIFMGIFLVAGVFGCGYAAEEPFTEKKLIFYFDSMVVLLIVLLLIDNLLVLMLVQPVMYTCFAAIALSLFSLVSQRAEQGKTEKNSSSPLAGRVLVAALLFLILLIAFGLVSIAASGTQSLSQALFELIKWLGTGLKTLGSTIMNALERFLTWLVSFLPEENFDTLEGSFEPSTMEGTYKSPGIPIPKWVWYILGALGALGLLRFFLSMLKERVGEEKAPAYTVPRSTRSGTLLSGLKELFSLLRGKLLFRITCIRGRKTAPGLLLWCEKHAPKDARRKQGESGSAFLLRLSQRNLPEVHSAALRELAGLVEKYFYSPASISLSPELYRLVRKIKF